MDQECTVASETQLVEVLKRRNQDKLRRIQILKLFLDGRENDQIFHLLQNNRKTFQEIPSIIKFFIDKFLEAIVKKINLYNELNQIAASTRKQNVTLLVHGERKKKCGKQFLSIFFKIALFFYEKKSLNRVKNKFLEYIWKTLSLQSFIFSKTLNKQVEGGSLMIEQQQSSTKLKRARHNRKNPPVIINLESENEQDQIKIEFQEVKYLPKAQSPEKEQAFKARLMETLRQIIRNQLSHEETK